MLIALDPFRIEQHARDLATELIEMVEPLDWAPFRPLSDPAASSHIVALTHPTLVADDVQRALAGTHNVVCSSRSGASGVAACLQRCERLGHAGGGSPGRPPTDCFAIHVSAGRPPVRSLNHRHHAERAVLYAPRAPAQGASRPAGRAPDRLRGRLRRSVPSGSSGTASGVAAVETSASAARPISSRRRPGRSRPSTLRHRTSGASPVDGSGARHWLPRGDLEPLRVELLVERPVMSGEARQLVRALDGARVRASRWSNPELALTAKCQRADRRHSGRSPGAHLSACGRTAARQQRSTPPSSPRVGPRGLRSR